MYIDNRPSLNYTEYMYIDNRPLLNYTWHSILVERGVVLIVIIFSVTIVMKNSYDNKGVAQSTEQYRQTEYMYIGNWPSLNYTWHSMLAEREVVS